MSNLSLDTCPGFLTPDYDNVCTNAAAGRNISSDTIIVELAAFWALNQKAQQAQWDGVVRAAAANKDTHLLAEKSQANTAELIIAHEKADADRKKAKIADFTEVSAVPKDIKASPSQYVLHKFSSFGHVELWYLTSEGCVDTALTAWSAPTEMFNITCTTGTLSFCLSAAHHPSRNVVQDYMLPWRQFSMGVPHRDPGH